MQDHGCNTGRNKVDLIVPPARATFFSYSLMCIGPKLWNALPDDLKDYNGESNANNFQLKLKKYIHQMQNTYYIYSIDNMVLCDLFSQLR